MHEKKEQGSNAEHNRAEIEDDGILAGETAAQENTSQRHSGN